MDSCSWLPFELSFLCFIFSIREMLMTQAERFTSEEVQFSTHLLSIYMKETLCSY